MSHRCLNCKKPLGECRCPDFLDTLDCHHRYDAQGRCLFCREPAPASVDGGSTSALRASAPEVFDALIAKVAAFMWEHHPRRDETMGVTSIEFWSEDELRQRMTFAFDEARELADADRIRTDARPAASVEADQPSALRASAPEGINARLAACGWDRPVQHGATFALWDDGNPHGNVFLVLPGGTMVPFGSCEGDIDEQRVRFIMDACNGVLASRAPASPTPEGQGDHGWREDALRLALTNVLACLHKAPRGHWSVLHDVGFDEVFAKAAALVTRTTPAEATNDNDKGEQG